MICKQCGANLPDESHFCPYCMTKFGGDGKEPEKSRIKTVLIAAVLIAVVLAVAAVIAKAVIKNSHSVNGAATTEYTRQSETAAPSTETQTGPGAETATAEIDGKYYEPGTYFWNIDGNGEIVLEDYEYYPF